MQIQSILPRAAEMYRRQLNEGLNANANAATKAREILRELFGGRIDLKPEGEGDSAGRCGSLVLVYRSGQTLDEELTPCRRFYASALRCRQRGGVADQ